VSRGSISIFVLPIGDGGCSSLVRSSTTCFSMGFTYNGGIVTRRGRMILTNRICEVSTLIFVNVEAIPYNYIINLVEPIGGCVPSVVAINFYVNISTRYVIT
jgi:hypothetical protein